MNGIIGAPDTHASRACFCCQLLSSTEGRDSAECVEGQASLLPLHGDHVIAACGRRLQDVLEVCVLEVADVSGVVAARLQDETCLLCLVKAAILAVWEAPMRTSLLDPCWRVGRHTPRARFGFSPSPRQCRLLSSLISLWITTSSLSVLIGRILTGRGPTVLASSNLNLRGFLKLTGISQMPWEK